MLIRLLIIVLFCLAVFQLQAQDTSAVSISPKYLEQVSSKANQLEQKLDKKTENALQQMRKQEIKMKKKLEKIDSIKAQEVFGDIDQKYKNLEQRLQGKLSGSYIPSLDTFSSSLKFLEQNPHLLFSKDAQQKLKNALENVNGLEDRFKKAEEIKKFLRERKQFLKTRLSNLSFAKDLKKIYKQVYYYQQQLEEYKSLLKDRKKAERKAIALLNRTKLFKSFMRRNSQLASLFRLPGEPGDPLAQTGLAGLQTRTQINNLIQQRVASGGANAQTQFRQNLRSAQDELNRLKNKVNGMGSGRSDMDMPEGFKPNKQKTKSFWNRLELGTNVQTQKATSFFPVTSDVGLSVGYRLNDKSIVGIGASYKIGWGQSFQHIKVSQQGAGLRSFIDWKVKGSFWMSGGFEMNYKTVFSNIDQLKNLNAWQQSGLVGLTKVVSIKNKFFNKTKLQMLWDFLSQRQAPKTSTFLVRVGYNF